MTKQSQPNQLYKWRMPGGPTRRMGGFILPESQADWIERIAKNERRPVAEVSRLLVQQGLKIYQRGSLICDWPNCSRVGCCDGASAGGTVSETPARILAFRPQPTPEGEAS